MSNRDYNSFAVNLPVGTTLSADNAVIRGTAFIGVRSLITGCRMLAEAAYTAVSGAYNTLTVKYVDPDGASGAICVFTPNTAAGSGMGNLTAGVDKVNGDTGVSLTSNVIVPKSSTIKCTLAKVGDGEPMTRVTIGLICEPTTA